MTSSPFTIQLESYEAYALYRELDLYCSKESPMTIIKQNLREQYFPTLIPEPGLHTIVRSDVTNALFIRVDRSVPNITDIHWLHMPSGDNSARGTFYSSWDQIISPVIVHVEQSTPQDSAIL